MFRKLIAFLTITYLGNITIANASTNIDVNNTKSFVNLFNTVDGQVYLGIDNIIVNKNIVTVTLFTKINASNMQTMCNTVRDVYKETCPSNISDFYKISQISINKITNQYCVSGSVYANSDGSSIVGKTSSDCSSALNNYDAIPALNGSVKYSLDPINLDSINVIIAKSTQYAK